MRYSNTTLKELTTRYKHVLLKCACLNAAIIAGSMMATPAMADSIMQGVSDQTVASKTHAGGLTIEYADDVTIGQDVTYNNNTNTIGAAGGIKALNGFTTGSGLTVSNNQGTFGGGLYIRLADDSSGSSIPTKRDITIGENSVFSENKATDGLGGAIGLESAGTVTIADGAKFTGNSATTDGGAIASWTDISNKVNGLVETTGSKLVLGKTSFENNTAGNRGGAIANLDDEKTNGVKNTVIVGEGSSFAGNTAGNGGAIYNEGILDIKDKVSFENNTATYQAGAIYNLGGDVTIGDNVLFKNNTAVGVGAIFNGDNGTMKIGKDSLFDGNIATHATGTAGAINNQNGALVIESGATFKNNSSIFGGGALYSETQSGSTGSDVTIKEGATFANNTSGSGGAIYQYGAGGQNITKMDIGANSKFENNKSLTQGGTRSGNGGAIMNYTAEMKIGNGTKFTGNTAQGNGGAIWNKGKLDLVSATFENNSAGQKGGAIYNDEDGEVSFTGDNTFKNNFNAGTLNDIFNDGTIVNSGNMFLNSGLVNNGTFTNTGSLSLNGITEINSAIDNAGGKITFNEDSSLKTSLMNGASIITGATGTVTGSTNLVIGNNSELGSFVIEGKNDLAFKSNALYDIADENGTYTVSKKSTSEVADSLAGQGVSNTQATTIVGMTEAKPTSVQGQAIADAITTAVQTGDTAAAKQLVDAVNPVSTPVVQTQAVGSAAQIMNVASSRMAAAGEGRSGGSMADFAYGPWIQGLYNKTHNSQGVGFDGYSQGFAAGVDVDVTDSTMLGVAYAYTATDINSNGRKTKVYGDNYMIYGKYQPSEWYIDGSLNYGHGSYHENSLGLKSKYNVDTYGGQALVGYQTGIFDNYAGARYVYVNPEKYSNGLTEVNAKNSQVGTAIIGTKISKEYKYQGVVWKPEFRLAATYDVKSDNSSSNVSIVGGNTTYTVHGKRLSRGAIQPGLGLKATVKNLDVILGYDAEFRSEQTSQTGTLKLQYNF